MSLAALIPAEHRDTANETLQSAGHGPGNFSVPAYTGTEVTHYALHLTFDINGIVEAIKALPHVAFTEYNPRSITEALCNTVGATLVDPNEEPIE